MGQEPASSRDRDIDEVWRSILTGEYAALNRVQRVFRSLPSPPRCKLCQAPFKGPYSPFLKMIGRRPSQLNQQICKICIGGLEKNIGGAEVPVSLLSTDVRGSTSLAEQMKPADFIALLNRFYTVVFEAVDSEFGLIDHIVGDGVMAMWIPGFAGYDHPQHAVAAGRRLAADLTNVPDLGDSFPAGVGVHTGVAYVGVVGEPGALDFTVLGDVANTAARLGSAAAGGELVISDDIAKAAHLDTSTLERRLLDLKGKAEAFPAWVEAVSTQQSSEI